MPRPTVSAIVPVYDRERLIARAVDSILAQEGVALETIVVDDGSTDGTAEVLAGYGERITVVRQENAGRSAARNAGLARARGELVAFLDSDDAWAPGKLARQVALHREHPDVGLSCHGWRVVHADGRAEERAPRYDPDALRARPYETLMDHFAFLPSVCMARRELATDVGGFATDYHGAEDLDFALKLARRAPLLAIPDPLALLYQHGGQTCRRQLARENARVLTRHLETLDDLDPVLRAKLCRKVARYLLSVAKRAESPAELQGLLETIRRLDPAAVWKSAGLRLRLRALWWRDEAKA